MKLAAWGTNVDWVNLRTVSKTQNTEFRQVNSWRLRKRELSYVIEKENETGLYLKILKSYLTIMIMIMKTNRL
jgi:hypothetical protein